MASIPSSEPSHYKASKMPKPVWTPCIQPSQIPMNVYREHVNKKFKLKLRNSQELQKWSVADPQSFWVDLWSYVKLIPNLPPGTNQAYNSNIPITEIPPFFEGVQINYAENVLTQPNVDPNTYALIGLREGQHLEGEKWSWVELRENVRMARSALLRSGIQQGDRVAAIISTSVWSVGLFLATASIGAIFTSIAPDLGEEGCVSRLEQVTPAILFADSHVTYKGRQKVNIPKIKAILNNLSKKPAVYLIKMVEHSCSDFQTLDGFLALSSTQDRLEFEGVSFSHPLYILYSSGTTGPPKCLVHQHGAIIQHKKIGILHNSLVAGEVVFQYSSTSWVLWNIMIGHLATGATLIMYDGSPLYPSPQAMLKIVEHHRVNYWGVSPRYLQELENTGCLPEDEFDLSSLRMVQTGGSHLAAHQYHWFYRKFPRKVHLTSVTGGTDLVTSWIATDPAGPLYAGELQLIVLGHDVDVVHPISGKSVKDTGEQGEFICRKPFPSMPVFMWGDERHTKYKAAYFDLDHFEYPCWAQHDWASFNPLTGGAQVHGRSDGVLNPQGIRFGSAEIYSIIDAPPFNSTIAESLCVGRRRRDKDFDESVFLFVVMQPSIHLSEQLAQSLKDAIRKGLSSRHVPRFIIEVKEIPHTVNGKKIETLVKEVICTGQMPKRISSTVANADCLQAFKKYYKIEENRAKL